MQNLQLKIPILGKFRGNVKILITRNLFCRKFSAMCQKISTSCPGLLS